MAHSLELWNMECRMWSQIYKNARTVSVRLTVLVFMHRVGCTTVMALPVICVVAFERTTSLMLYPTLSVFMPSWTPTTKGETSTYTW
jgi:hypothetical protein